MPVVSGNSDLENLTRRHAIKIESHVGVSVEEVSLAVGKVVGFKSIKSASRMNGCIVIFLDDVAKVEHVVENGIVVHDTFMPVVPLVNPAKKVVISNAPPFIKNEDLQRELSRFGQLVSPIRLVLLGCKSPELKHVVCHRRQVYMILRDNTSDLNLTLSFKIDGYNYMVFVTSDTMKCFGCGKEGHLIRSCPEAGERAGPSGVMKKTTEVAGESKTSETPRSVVQLEELGLQQSAGNDIAKNVQEIGREKCRSEQSMEQTKIVGENKVAETNIETSENNNVTNINGCNKDKESCSQHNDEAGENVGKKMDKLNNSGQKSQVDVGGPKECEIKAIQKKMFGPTAVIDKQIALYSYEEKSLTSKPNKRKSDEEEQIGTKTKKALEVCSDEECEWTSSQEGDFVSYPFEKIKKFLVDTKGHRGVKVEEYFPDLRGFVKSIGSLRKEVSNFSDPEIYRLKKLVTKVKTYLEDDNE